MLILARNLSDSNNMQWVVDDCLACENMLAGNVIVKIIYCLLHSNDAM